nr:hypothetical protein [uncultured Rhodopila sp.]
MTDDPLHALTDLNRVSIRAVLAPDGEDVGQALAQAGIIDPVSIPVLTGEDADTGVWLGDGITPNLTGVLEPDEEQDSETAGARPANSVAAAHADWPETRLRTAMLPQTHGMQPFAPVRKRDS